MRKVLVAILLQSLLMLYISNGERESSRKGLQNETEL